MFLMRFVSSHTTDQSENEFRREKKRETQADGKVLCKYCRKKFLFFFPRWFRFAGGISLSSEFLTYSDLSVSYFFFEILVLFVLVLARNRRNDLKEVVFFSVYFYEKSWKISWDLLSNDTALHFIFDCWLYGKRNSRG